MQPLPVDATPPPLRLIAPSLPRRMACWLYEGMLLFGVVFIAGYLFSALTQTRHALDNRHAQQAFLFVVLGIYFTWFWHDAWAGTRLVDSRTHPTNVAS